MPQGERDGEGENERERERVRGRSLISTTTTLDSIYFLIASELEERMRTVVV